MPKLNSFNEETFSKGKMYVLKTRRHYYKLHRIDKEYAWCNFENMTGYSNGRHSTPEECLKTGFQQGQEVYEFESLKECMQTLINNI